MQQETFCPRLGRPPETRTPTSKTPSHKVSYVSPPKVCSCKKRAQRVAHPFEFLLIESPHRGCPILRAFRRVGFTNLGATCFCSPLSCPCSFRIAAEHRYRKLQCRSSTSSAIPDRPARASQDQLAETSCRDHSNYEARGIHSRERSTPPQACPFRPGQRCS